MKPIIFLDIDGTLLDYNYKVTSNKTKQIISSMKKDGFLFGLNSNRSTKDILDVARVFNIKDLIIAENGIVILENQEEKLLLEADVINRKIIDIISDISNSTFANIRVVDTVKEKGMSGAGLCYSVNMFRKYTSSIHVTKDNKMSLENAEELKLLLEQKLGSEYSISVSDKFANVLVAPRNSGKKLGLQKLLESGKYVGRDVIMVGDDNADLELRDVVAKFFAVGNCTKELRKASDYVSRLKYTRGVEDILKKIRISYNK